MSDDITTGELGRRIDAMAGTLSEVNEKLDDRPDWKDVSRMETAQKERDDEQNRAIKASQDSSTWLFRTACSALIVGLAGLLFSLIGR